METMIYGNNGSNNDYGNVGDKDNFGFDGSK